MEKCAQSMLRLLFGFARFALGNTGFLRVSWVELHDDGWFFRRSVRHFFGLLFGVEALPINDYGAVDIHTFIDSSEQQ